MFLETKSDDCHATPVLIAIAVEHEGNDEGRKLPALFKAAPEITSLKTYPMLIFVATWISWNAPRHKIVASSVLGSEPLRCDTDPLR